jgi:hypothetical protein
VRLRGRYSALGAGDEVGQALPRHIHYVLIKLNNILDISFDFGKNANR